MELHDLSALDQAARIRDGGLRSEDLVAHYLDRIRRLDPRYSAFVSLQAERALRAARAKDRGRGQRALPPFHGVPIAVKDLHFVRGAPTKMGSRAFRWLWSPIDDVTVQALRRAGFVLLGKLSTSELGLLPIVEPQIHAATRNPWNPDFTAGGSSGGSGAAVAAGLIPFAPGSDGAGSIRIPSSLNGLFGLKPTRGRVPNPHAAHDRYGMTAIGPMARSVEDGAALLDVLVGRDPRRSGSFLGAARTPASPARVGVIVDAPIGQTDPGIAAAVGDAARALASDGHVPVERASPRTDLAAFLPVYQRLLANAPVLAERSLEPMTQWFRAEGRSRPTSEADDAFRALSELSASAIGDCDVVVCPTVPVTPPRVGAHAHRPPPEAFAALASLGACTAASNLSGAPAVSVPWSRDAHGVPIGVQIVGRPGQEERLLALARTLERARPAVFGVAPDCR